MNPRKSIKTSKNFAVILTDEITLISQIVYKNWVMLQFQWYT